MATNNVVLSPKMYTKLVLMSLGGKMNVARNMSKAVTDEFANKAMKIGDTVSVRKPYRFVGGDGLAWDPEALSDQVTPISVNSVPHVHFQWDSVERTLDIREAMELYADPVAKALAAKINSGAATFAAQNALNSVGTPGTVPSTEATYLSAGDRLIELGLPDDEELNLIVNRRQSSAFVSGVKALFNPTGAISAQWRKGVIQDSLGYNVFRDQTINTHTVGTYGGTPLINGAQQAEGGNNATMTLNTNGWTSGGTSLKKGDKFTIGSAASATLNGVNSVHPQTRRDTGQQQIITVQNDISDTTGTINMVVAPAITPSGQYQNVTIAAPASGIITMVGATGATSQQGLLMHKNAFAFVSVKMSAPLPNGVEAVEQEYDEETGLWTRYVRYFDGDNSIHKHRFDCLIGYGSLYKEMACVIQS